MKENILYNHSFAIQTPLPSKIFLYAFLIFNFLPSLYLFVTNYYEGLYGASDTKDYYNALYLNFIIIIIFGMLYLIFLLIFKLFLKVKSNYSVVLIGNTKKIFNENILIKTSTQSYFVSKQMYNFVLRFGAFGSILVWIYFFSGGYEKLLLLGADVDQWEFRIISYDDRSRFLIAFLEVARRFILPFTCVYLLVFKSMKINYTKKRVIYFYLFSLLLSGIMTLDRGPILLFFVMFIFVKINFKISKFQYFFGSIISLLGIIFLASVLTYLQYNILDFSFSQVFESALNFLWHRTILVPSIASIELSYYNFPLGSDKLYLSFSRLGAIFGKDYIAIGDANSLYVTPVGFIADIWRNVGLAGIVVFSIFFAFLFSKLDSIQSKLSPIMRIPFSFTTLSFCFFLIFGVFFSQGIFVHIIMMFIVGSALKNENIRHSYDA
ncbi:MAG: hypothetical protein RLY15_212 [Bacteroidota bacterium]|jgi:uncharacterized integral membrane protein